MESNRVLLANRALLEISSVFLFDFYGISAVLSYLILIVGAVLEPASTEQRFSFYDTSFTSVEIRDVKLTLNLTEFHFPVSF